MPTTLILLSLAGVVISVLVGTIWYSDKTPMGRVHMKYLGFDKLSKAEQQKKIKEAMPGMPKIYGAQMLLSFLTSFAVVYVITESLRNGLSFGMALGFVMMNWLCFIVPVIGSNILWGNSEGKLAWQRFFSETLANLVTLVLVASMTNLFV